MQPSEVEAFLKSIQERIVAGQYEHALAALQQRDPELSGDPEALYMEAVCYRYLKRFDDALATLAELQSQVPEHGRAYQEEGHTCLAVNDKDRALRAFRLATRFNPALFASWKAQVQLLSEQGMQEEANLAQAQLTFLQNLPKPLLGVRDLISQGKLLKAEDLCRAFLKKVPHHVEAMRLLADIGVRLGVLDDAEFLLESAVEFQPDNLGARVDYVQALRKRQRFDKAVEQSKALLERAPDNPQFQSLFAISSMQTGDYSGAISQFDRILEKRPGDPVTLTSRGHALKTHGDYDEAVNSFQHARDSEPLHGEAYYALANLKVYRFSDQEIESMLAVEAGTELTFNDRIYLDFALGKAFEDGGDYSHSFEFYSKGNDLKKRQCRYEAAQVTEEMAAQARVCEPYLFEKNAASGCAEPDPILIVGLPRAGSTLLEQILASHSQVDGTMELPNVISLAHRLRRLGQQGGGGYPDVLAELTHEQLAAFGQEYIEDTRIHRQGAPYFIDKMPNNFRHIGLIKLILPNAKIIDARREPMSCCFSGFKQLFAEGQEFSYSLEDIGTYYKDYVQLMNHWDKVLPGYVLRVHHEDVVADLEGQVRRMLDFCDLPFEESCVHYYETDRDVRTPSSEQVRQPIFTDALEQWKNYEPWLGPLKEALGEFPE